MLCALKVRFWDWVECPVVAHSSSQVIVATHHYRLIDIARCACSGGMVHEFRE
jgi:hypothetical protein